MLNRTLVLPLALVLPWLAGCDIEELAGSARYTEDFHHSYHLKAGGRLAVENFNGSVEISGWDQDSVDISGTKYGSTPELRDDVKIEITPASDSVYVRTVRPSIGHGNMGAKYIIRVPRRVQLERVTSSNGTIRVTDIEGAARLKTSNGTVRAVNLKGNLDVHTSNGSVEVEKLDGAAMLRTSNGRIHADEVSGAFDAETSNGGITARLLRSEAGRPLRLETSNGSVDLTLRDEGQNDIRVATSNGGITLHLPASTGGRLVANTSNSSITTEFDVRTQGVINKHHLEGTIGNGGPTFDLSTSNGSIRILKL